MTNTQIATFGAGCFWGVEEIYRTTPGAIKTTVGYTGGKLENPTYEQVCMGNTGHAESVQIEFDPEIVSYEKLLEIFWANHNPTTKDRQGPDVGHQYRSVIFYHTPEQREIAEKSKAAFDASGKYDVPAVTEIVPAETFYDAEAYHQQYLKKRGLDACHI
jgi:peptide-methionine (S)-S-oxide reductase